MKCTVQLRAKKLCFGRVLYQQVAGIPVKPLLLGEGCKNTRKTSKLLVVLMGIDRRMARLNISFSAVKLFLYIFTIKGMDINLIKACGVFFEVQTI